MVTALLSPGDQPPAVALPVAHVEQIDVSLVLLPVVVRDAKGKPVLDLKREDFTVLDEGSRQEITAFGREERPVSIFLALDTSESMRAQEMAVKRAALDLVRGQREGTAFALGVFNDVVLLEADFTTDRKAMEWSVGSVRASGEQTALFDALAAAARHLEGRDGGRIAVVFTDGTETVHPQDQAEERLSSAIEAAVRRDASVYTVAFGARAATGLLQRVSDETGGEMVRASTPGELAAAFANVAESVGSRYLIGYPPPQGAPKGFRSVEVKVDRAGVRVAARHGYYVR
jgi:VWFA-related protein